jgi:hypothetical protein
MVGSLLKRMVGSSGRDEFNAKVWEAEMGLEKARDQEWLLL